VQTKSSASPKKRAPNRRAANTRRAPKARTSTQTRDNRFRVGRSRTGLGLFAVEPIKRGEFIIEYWGKLVRCKDADELQTKYLFDLSTRWAIDGADRRNIARYINHSCKPNAIVHTIRSSIRIFAKRTIQPGEEIAYNYGRDYFEKFIEPIGCKCEACLEQRRRPRRKRVRGRK
jgi:SET domain-containing protein